jgi:hypothetical protein
VLDHDLRDLERLWADGQGEVAAGVALLRALERADACFERWIAVRQSVLSRQVAEAGVGRVALSRASDFDRAAFSFTLPGSRAIEAWEGLRACMDATRAYPLLLGSPEGLSHLLESMDINDEGEEEVTTEQIVEDALRLSPDPCAWYLEDYGEPVKITPDEPWPAFDESAREYSIPGASDEVQIVLLPTIVPWHAAAYLRWGGWNACPYAERHVALHRLWHDRWGAEPVGMTHDVLEMRVSRPPRTREEAIALARDHYAYCEDIVSQQNGTIFELAATLLDGTVWHFWWD